MQPLKLLVLILILFLHLNSINIKAQMLQQDSVTLSNFATPKLDSLSFKYNFTPGDTLIYNVVSWDSISIDYSSVLKKNREEIIQIIIDSIGQNKHFYITYSLISVKSDEMQDKNETKNHISSTWLNRNIKIEIDSLGKRFNSFSLDTSGSMSPGGAFQPLLIFPFAASTKAINETWLTSDTFKLSENGFPTPIFKNFSLNRLVGRKDTLNDSTIQVDFNRTGTGEVFVLSNTVRVKNISIINSYGQLYISIEKKLPIFLYVTQEQKLTLYLPNDRQKKGYHYTTSYFKLIEQKHKLQNTEIKINPSPKIKKQIRKY